MSERRWQLMVTPDGRAPGAAKAPDEGALRNGWSCVPVVPCNDAAIERAVEALREHDMPGPEDVTRWIVGIVLTACAGETP